MLTLKCADTLQKVLRCLKCGKPRLTDRCHRICPRCTKANGRLGVRALQTPVPWESFVENDDG